VGDPYPVDRSAEDAVIGLRATGIGRQFRLEPELLQGDSPQGGLHQRRYSPLIKRVPVTESF